MRGKATLTKDESCPYCQHVGLVFVPVDANYGEYRCAACEAVHSVMEIEDHAELARLRAELEQARRERDEAWVELEMRRIDREDAQDDADASEAIDESRLIEELAEYAHNAWAGWMQYLFSKCERRTDMTYLVPLWAVDRWWRQMQTDYSDLPDNEKESDRVEARKMLSIVQADRQAGKE